MATKKKKHFVKLQCSVCQEINYLTRKSAQKRSPEKKLLLKKYCPICRKHTEHKETKK